MQLEVEQKFRVAGFEEIQQHLADLACTCSDRSQQIDRYFAHPSRDFSVTDEAFRFRCAGDSNWITYKGPRLDTTTKSRRELDLPLPDGPSYCDQFLSLLELLGFREVAAVEKQRRKAFIDWNGSQVEISLDEVLHVGTYVELEIMTEDSGFSAAKECLNSLAKRLGLTQIERRSYLNLLLESRQKGDR
jgi:adenylate cyclase, class 2